MGCNPECYTKGRGCVVSNQGRCALLFEYKPKIMVKSFQEAFDELVKGNKGYKSTYTSKKIRKIAP